MKKSFPEYVFKLSEINEYIFLGEWFDSVYLISKNQILKKLL